jgi:ribonuclease BN (tRNA processing enzyme)
VNLTTVGSGTAAPDPHRVGSALFVEFRGRRVLLDCGPGAVHHLARFRLPWPRLDHLVITHFHNDHIGDIPALFFALKWGVEKARTAPLTLWGPPGLRLRLEAMATAFGDHVREPGFPVHVQEIEAGARIDLGGLHLTAASSAHTLESLAYRFQDEDGAILGCTGDTGPSEPLARFLAGCDVMVAECSLPDDQAMDTHLTPRTLAAMARLADPGTLVVTHEYPQLARQDVLSLLRASGWDGATSRAHDGLSIQVRPR